MKRFSPWAGGLMLVLAGSFAIFGSCRKRPAGPLKSKSPVIYHYTPLPEPPTPTLRPGQPTRHPEPAC